MGCQNWKSAWALERRRRLQAGLAQYSCSQPVVQTKGRRGAADHTGLQSLEEGFLQRPGMPLSSVLEEQASCQEKT